MLKYLVRAEPKASEAEGVAGTDRDIGLGLTGVTAPVTVTSASGRASATPGSALQKSVSESQTEKRKLTEEQQQLKHNSYDKNKRSRTYGEGWERVFPGWTKPKYQKVKPRR